MFSVDAFPSTRRIVKSVKSTQEGLRTVHNDFHSVHKTIDYLQGLGHGHTGLFLSESVQSPEHSLDLALPQ